MDKLLIPKTDLKEVTIDQIINEELKERCLEAWDDEIWAVWEVNKEGKGNLILYENGRFDLATKDYIDSGQWGSQDNDYILLFI